VDRLRTRADGEPWPSTPSPRHSISGRPGGASLSKRPRRVVAAWRESQKFKSSHGGAADAAEKSKGPPPGAMGMMLEPPSVALFEGKLMLAAQ
jgi:hypothetical protein